MIYDISKETIAFCAAISAQAGFTNTDPAVTYFAATSVVLVAANETSGSWFVDFQTPETPKSPGITPPTPNTLFFGMWDCRINGGANVANSTGFGLQKWSSYKGEQIPTVYFNGTIVPQNSGVGGVTESNFAASSGGNYQLFQFFEFDYTPYLADGGRDLFATFNFVGLKIAGQ